jgi:hypothetical protein
MIDSPLKHTIRTKHRRDLLAERLSNRYEWQATLEPCLVLMKINELRQKPAKEISLFGDISVQADR